MVRKEHGNGIFRNLIGKSEYGAPSLYARLQPSTLNRQSMISSLKQAINNILQINLTKHVVPPI